MVDPEIKDMALSGSAPGASLSTPRFAEKVIVISHLYKSFGPNQVLQDFNLALYKGQNIVVLGKSGSGKSVLIKCIIGLLRPDHGEIFVFGKNIPDLDHFTLDELRARIGFLFQSNALYDSMTVRDNLEFPLRRHWIQVTQAQVNEMVMEALEDVGLAHTVDMMPVELSGGMRKRIALARTLILKPDIILYDEPTTGLDPITADAINDLIVEMTKELGCAAVSITHDMASARKIADEIAMLHNGKIVWRGPTASLDNSGNAMVDQFVAGRADGPIQAVV